MTKEMVILRIYRAGRLLSLRCLLSLAQPSGLIVIQAQRYCAVKGQVLLHSTPFIPRRDHGEEENMAGQLRIIRVCLYALPRQRLCSLKGSYQPTAPNRSITHTSKYTLPADKNSNNSLSFCVFQPNGSCGRSGCLLPTQCRILPHSAA